MKGTGDPYGEGGAVIVAGFAIAKQEHGANCDTWSEAPLFTFIAVLDRSEWTPSFCLLSSYEAFVGGPCCLSFLRIRFHDQQTKWRKGDGAICVPVDTNGAGVGFLYQIVGARSPPRRWLEPFLQKKRWKLEWMQRSWLWIVEDEAGSTLAWREIHEKVCWSLRRVRSISLDEYYLIYVHLVQKSLHS